MEIPPRPGRARRQENYPKRGRKSWKRSQAGLGLRNAQYETMQNPTRGGRFFDPEEALKFGLIDKVITNREDK